MASMLGYDSFFLSITYNKTCKESNEGNGPRIASLHYADDAIFLGEWNDYNLGNLMKILKCFHQASGLNINWNKSTWWAVKKDAFRLFIWVCH